MRIRVVLIFLAILINYGIAYSQHDSITHRKIDFAIKTDVFLPVLGLFDDVKLLSLTFGSSFKQRHSLQITGYWVNTNYSGKSTSILIVPEYRIFLNKLSNYNGMYTGLYIKFMQTYFRDEFYHYYTPYFSYIEYKQYSIAAGPVFGYQKYVKQHMVIDFFIGAGIYRLLNTEITDQGTVESIIFDKYRFDMLLGINLGYKF